MLAPLFNQSRPLAPKPTQHDHQANAQQNIADQQPNNVNLPTINDNTAARGGQGTKTIMSRLRFPIDFNSADHECNWCRDLYYGLCGTSLHQVVFSRGEDGVDVVVKDSSSEQISCHMCSKCTSDRLAIMTCGKHSMERVGAEKGSGVSSKPFLQPGKAADAPFKWCSLCTGRASFSCSTEAGPHHTNGCGLYLCGECNDRLDYPSVNGDLDKLVEKLKQQRHPIRADLELLRGDGYLKQRF